MALAAIAPVISIIGTVASLAFMGGGGAPAPAAPPQIPPPPTPPPSVDEKEVADIESAKRRDASRARIERQGSFLELEEEEKLPRAIPTLLGDDT